MPRPSTPGVLSDSELETSRRYSVKLKKQVAIILMAGREKRSRVMFGDGVNCPQLLLRQFTR